MQGFLPGPHVLAWGPPCVGLFPWGRSRGMCSHCAAGQHFPWMRVHNRCTLFFQEKKLGEKSVTVMRWNTVASQSSACFHTGQSEEDKASGKTVGFISGGGDPSELDYTTLTVSKNYQHGWLLSRTIFNNDTHHQAPTATSVSKEDSRSLWKWNSEPTF